MRIPSNPAWLPEETKETLNPRPLPISALELLARLDAPARLVAHLTLTHEVAGGLLEQLLRRWPTLPVDREAVLFGAATHDAGKARCVEELSAPGNRHEREGESLLLSLGVPPEWARFCRTHGAWNEESPLEDLLAALADTIWKGKRDASLEDAAFSRIATLAQEVRCKVYLALDDILTELAQDADARLAWQRNHSVRN